MECTAVRGAACTCGRTAAAALCTNRWPGSDRGGWRWRWEDTRRWRRRGRCHRAPGSAHHVGERPSRVGMQGESRRLLDFQVKTQQRLWCQISAGAAHPVLRRSLLGRYHVRLESWLRGGAKWWRGEYEARRPGSIAMLLLLVKSLSAQNQ